MTRPPQTGDDWDDLAAAWTAPQTEMVADPALTRAVRRRARLGRANFLLEVGGSVAAGVIGVWAALRNGAPGVALAVVLFAGFALTMTLWARRGLPPEAADSPAGALRAAVAQARSGLRWARAGQAVGLAALLFVAVVAANQGVAVGDPLIVFAVVFVLAAVALHERHARRCRARLSRHAAALAELEG